MGRDLLADLGWKADLPLKIMWGNGPQRGLARIVPMTGTGVRGWNIRVGAKGHAWLRTKVFPSNCTKVVHQNTLMEYAHAPVVNDPDKRKFLEVQFPDDFFGEEVVPTTAKPPARKLADEPEVVPLKQAASKLTVQNGKAEDAPVAVTTRSTPADLIDYLVKMMGEAASVKLDGTIIVNGDPYTFDAVLRQVNAHRSTKGLPALVA